MFRFAIVFLLLLTFYHIARFAEVLYRARKEFLDRAKRFQNPEEREEPRQIILKEKESLLGHHCLCGGPFVWILAPVVYFILLNNIKIETIKKNDIQDWREFSFVL